MATTRLIAPGIGDAGSRTLGRHGYGTAPQCRADRVAAWVKLRKAAAKPGELISDGLVCAGHARGAGSDIIFTRLAQDMAAIGLRLRRVSLGDPADLRISTRLPVIRPEWFLQPVALRRA
jgi:hypothetical protein